MNVLFAGIVLAWVLVALVYRDPHYDYWAVAASTAVLSAGLAFYGWTPAPGLASYRLLGLAVAGQAFLSAGMSVIVEVETSSLYVTPKQDAFSAAVWSSVAFALIFLVGAFITAPKSQQSLPDPPTAASGLTPKVAIGLAAATAGMNLAFLFYPSLSALGTLPIVLFNMGMVAPMLAAQLSLGKRKSLAPIAILLLSQAATTFYTSLLGSLVLTMRDVLLARIYLRLRMPKALIAAMIAVVVVLNPAKALFRAALASGPARTNQGMLDFGQTSALWADAVTDTWSPGRHGNRDRSAELKTTTNRLNYNWISAHIFSVVPYRVPYQDGDTYSIIPAVLVPRLLYPDKPNTATYGRAQWFIKLGIQDRRTVQTAAFALPAPAEAYWNFGWPGVFVVPIVLGALTGFMLRLGPRDPIARVGYVVLLATTLGQFLDMVVWIIPNFFVVGVGGILGALYCRLGKGELLNWGKATSVHRSSPSGPNQPEPSRVAGLNTEAPSA